MTGRPLQNSYYNEALNADVAGLSEWKKLTSIWVRWTSHDLINQGKDADLLCIDRPFDTAPESLMRMQNLQTSELRIYGPVTHLNVPPDTPAKKHLYSIWMRYGTKGVKMTRDINTIELTLNHFLLQGINHLSLADTQREIQKLILPLLGVFSSLLLSSFPLCFISLKHH